MKKIGQGLSYTVYDLDNGRVLKKPTFYFYKFSKLLFWSVWHRFNFSLIKKLRPIISSGKESIEILRKYSDKIDLKVIGFPEFCSSLEYSQDKVLILREYFKLHSIEENKIVIDNYIQNIFQTWKNGFSDIDFNFAMNSGVNDKGFVVLADINGLSFSKEEILKLIKSRTWLSKWSYESLDDLDLKYYFKSEMNRNLTKKNLDKFWKDLF